MKIRTSSGPRAASSYSRQAARFFASREWLDRPLLPAPQPNQQPLNVRLVEVARKVVG